MIRNTLILFILLLISIYGFANKPLKIGVISDTHYLSEKLMDNGSALQQYTKSSGRDIKNVATIIDQVLEDYLNIPDLNILLVSGDMTKDGEKQSHIDFVNKLKPLQDKGVRVFVIPGNHDINRFNYAVGYKDNTTYHTDYTTPTDFRYIYQNCGYDNALETDTTSLSYVANLDDKTWLLAIDAAEYDRYDKGFVSSGKIKESTEKWIIDILDRANNQNIDVIAMMHWGLTEHIPYQSTFFADYLVTDWEKYASLLADKGVKVIFTGHFHSNDISAYTSPKGNTIYDIETGTLVSYPFAYRLIDYNGNEMDITTRNVTSIPSNSKLVEESKLQLEAIAENMAKKKLSNMGLDNDTEITDQLSKVIAQLFIIHLGGDEKLTDDIKKQINRLAIFMDADIEDIDDFKIDFEPADNNVIIKF